MNSNEDIEIRYYDRIIPMARELYEEHMRFAEELLNRIIAEMEEDK